MFMFNIGVQVDIYYFFRMDRIL